MLTEDAMYALFAIIFVLCTTLVGIALLAWDVLKGVTAKSVKAAEMPMWTETKTYLPKEKDDDEGRND